MNTKPNILSDESKVLIRKRGKRKANWSGQRHWFRITGLPGWKRKQLGVPAFGNATCVPPATK